MIYPKPRGRPKSSEKQEAILDAASKLFLEEGVQGTSMDAVARCAGVSKQTVYSHFENKEALFRACIMTKVRESRLTPEDLPHEEPLEEALTTVARRFLELIFDDEVLAMYRVVIAESGAHRNIAEAVFELGPRRTIGMVGEFLARRVARGELVVDDLEHAATLFLTLVRGKHHIVLLMHLGSRPEGAELAAHLARTVREFLTLYGAR